MARAAARPRGAVVSLGAGAVVMGTGIVSVALLADGEPLLSRALLALAAMLWVALAAVFCRRLLADPGAVAAEAASPAALTTVAASAVLGARLVDAGWHTPGAALLVASCLLWCLLIPAARGALRRSHEGSAFLVTVATEALAVLRPLRLGYDLRRWSTVFPLGMYAVCSFAVAQASGASVPREFARGWAWVAFAGWLAVAVAALLRVRRPG